ncbi:MAG: efflux RND transporter periplasmic adaptor subunit [Bacteroidota bacterium]
MKITPTVSLVFTAIIILWSCNKSEKASAETKDITQAVYASGKILPLNHYLVIARFPGYIDKIHVKSGDMVHAGEPLVTLRNEANEFAISSASNIEDLARRNADSNGPLLSSIREDLQATRSKYELDSINFVRNSSLLREDAISRVVFDQSKTQLDLSRSAYQRSKSNYQSATDRSRTEYLNAVNQSRSQRSTRNDYVLTAAIDGKVYDVVPKVGDLVTAQSLIVEMGAADSFEVELSIDETDIGLVKLGQQVIFGIDAYPDKPFKGTITEIVPKVILNNKSSRVKADITSIPDCPLFSGMSVEGNIVIGTKKNCLVVPRDYVKNGNQIKVEGEEKPRTIRKGLEDLQHIEVIEGLTGDETIIK